MKGVRTMKTFVILIQINKTMNLWFCFVLCNYALSINNLISPSTVTGWQKEIKIDATFILTNVFWIKRAVRNCRLRGNRLLHSFFFIRRKFIRTSKLELPHKIKNICKLSWFFLKMHYILRTFLISNLKTLKNLRTFLT